MVYSDRARLYNLVYSDRTRLVAIYFNHILVSDWLYGHDDDFPLIVERNEHNYYTFRRSKRLESNRELRYDLEPDISKTATPFYVCRP